MTQDDHDRVFSIESCHSVWEFDPSRMYYRRHLKGTGRNTGATEWVQYWGLLFEEKSDSFVVLLNVSGTRLIRSFRHGTDCAFCAERHTEQLNLLAIRRSGDE